MISAFDAHYDIKNLFNIIVLELRIQGLLVYSLRGKYAKEFQSDFVPRVSKGEIKYKEHLVRGLENGGEAIVDVQKGRNLGKVVVVVADD